MEDALTALKTALPCRHNQIEQLHNLYSPVDDAFVDSVYVYGGPSTGKSAVVAAILDRLQIKHAVANLIECYTARILFESILNELSGHQMDPENPQPYARCDSLMDFIFHLKKLSEIEDLNGSVLVLDKAEELRNMDFNLLPAFLRFRELSGISLSVIFLSEIVFEKYHGRSVVEPIKVYFPQYSKDELLEILSLDADHAKEMLKQQDESLEFNMDFYKNYLNVFLSVFYRACRDLSELRYMSRKNFVKYCQPIINKQHTITDSMALWRNIAPTLKSSLEVLYLRVDSTQQQHPTKENLELPFYAKYLLIAAYLASYNSAKDDKRLFVKYHGKKTKTKRDVKTKSKVSERLNTQLGPKPFTFDRLLAIFYSILDEKVGFNNNLLVQVSSLVELRLLSGASESCTLDGQKYKCNVGFDFVHGVARTVGFNVRKYLSDFSHM